MPAKKQLEIQVHALEGQVATHRHWGHIHSKAADELAQTNRRLRKELATAQERVEELEARLKPKSTTPEQAEAQFKNARRLMDRSRAVSREARASVALDAPDSSASTRSYWDLPEKFDEWNQGYGRCQVCGMPFSIVRPGKGQPACDCEEEAPDASD